MVQSLNKKVDLTINATSYLGMKLLNITMIKTSMIIFKFLGLK